jgi:hypothetical protein
MAINFFDPETTQVSNGGLLLAGSLSSLSKSAIIPVIKSSKTATGIELRMLPPLIKDNHTPALWPFPGYSKLYCLTIVVSDVTNQLAGAIDLKGFPRIGDNERLPINKTIFYWQSSGKKEAAPNQVHTMCTIMKSKEGLREAGQIMGSVKDDGDYKNLISTLGKVGKGVAKFNAVTDIVVQIAGVVGKYLGKVEDKPLGTIINSYTTLHGDFDKMGISQLVYPTRDVDFEFQMVVRQQKEETAIAEKMATSKSFSFKKRELNLGMQEEVEVDMLPL